MARMLGMGAAGGRRAVSSSSSSSIGEFSGLTAATGGGKGWDDGEEVQSAYTGPLDTLVEVLEDSLPMRRGISRFYSGKTKSFANLAVAMATCKSAKDLVKPEDPITRKRRNLIAYKYLHGMGPNWDHLMNLDGSNPKRPANSTPWTTLRAPVVNLPDIESDSNSDSNEEEQDEVSHLPPLHTPDMFDASQRNSVQLRSSL